MAYKRQQKRWVQTRLLFGKNKICPRFTIFLNDDNENDDEDKFNISANREKINELKNASIVKNRAIKETQKGTIRETVLQS